MNEVAVEKRRGEISLGAAGLVLVLMRLLQFASLGAKDIGDTLWFISAVGILASFVGLIVCLVALVNGSGRWLGLGGLVLYGLLALVFLVL